MKKGEGDATSEHNEMTDTDGPRAEGILRNGWETEDFRGSIP